MRLVFTAPGVAEPAVLDEAELSWPSPAGVRDYQLLQTGPDSLLVRWTPAAGSGVGTEQGLRAALTRMLDDAGLPAGAVRISAERVAAIAPDPGSGKVKRLVPLAGGTAAATRPVEVPG
jgi:hypothetical protein